MRKTAKTLANEIFALVEREQGYAFISDGLNNLRSPSIVFAVVRAALKHTKVSARLMSGWLKKYGKA